MTPQAYRRRSLGALTWLLAAALTAGSCHSSLKPEQPNTQSADPTARPTLPGVGTPTAGANPALPPPKPEEIAVRIGAWQTKAKEMDFGIKPENLLGQFIHEFGDGTVIDKVLVTPVQDTPKDKPTYYLVGMGQLNGQFRAMALPLKFSADDGSLYLLPSAARHFAIGTNCVLCYFSFSRGEVTGVDCSEESTGAVERRCAYKTVPGNGFFANK